MRSWFQKIIFLCGLWDHHNRKWKYQLITVTISWNTNWIAFWWVFPIFLDFKVRTVLDVFRWWVWIQKYLFSWKKLFLERIAFFNHSETMRLFSKLQCQDVLKRGVINLSAVFCWNERWSRNLCLAGFIFLCLSFHLVLVFVELRMSCFHFSLRILNNQTMSQVPKSQIVD